MLKSFNDLIISDNIHELDNWNPLEENSTGQAKHEASQKDRLFQRFIAMLHHPANTEREVTNILFIIYRIANPYIPPRLD